MISRQGRITARRISAGDASVDGLFSGLGAGVIMIVVLMLLSLFRGGDPVMVLSRFSASAGASPWTGLLSHLAVSGIYGIAFGLIARWLLPHWPGRSASWLPGLLYGLALFLVAELIILPGTHSPLRDIPLLDFGFVHLVYGLMLGLLIVRREDA